MDASSLLNNQDEHNIDGTYRHTLTSYVNSDDGYLYMKVTGVTSESKAIHYAVYEY